MNIVDHHIMDLKFGLMLLITSFLTLIAGSRTCATHRSRGSGNRCNNSIHIHLE